MKNYGELKDTSKEYITKIINNSYIYIYIYIYSYYLIKYWIEFIFKWKKEII